MSKVTIYSVMHTGTHFCKQFVEELGLETYQLHSQPTDINHIWSRKGTKAVVPVRHPYLTFCSHFQRNGTIRECGTDAYMTMVCGQYRCLLDTLHILDWVPLQIDCPAEQRLSQLKRAWDHVRPELDCEGSEEELAKEEELREQRANGVIMTTGMTWKIRGWFTHRFDLPNDIDWSKLDFALKYFGYQPMDMTGYKHVEGEDQYQIEILPGAGVNVIAPKVKAKGYAIVRGPDGKIKQDEVA